MAFLVKVSNAAAELRNPSMNTPFRKASVPILFNGEFWVFSQKIKHNSGGQKFQPCLKHIMALLGRMPSLRMRQLCPSKALYGWTCLQQINIPLQVWHNSLPTRSSWYYGWAEKAARLIAGCSLTSLKHGTKTNLQPIPLYVFQILINTVK